MNKNDSAGNSPDISDTRMSIALGNLDLNENADHPGLQTIESLIALHAKNSVAKEYECDDITPESSYPHQNTSKTIIFSKIITECEKGLRISIDDDFTADYDEYIIGLEAKEFSMKQTSLYSDLKNKFRAHI